MERKRKRKGKLFGLSLYLLLAVHCSHENKSDDCPCLDLLV